MVSLAIYLVSALLLPVIRKIVTVSALVGAASC